MVDAPVSKEYVATLNKIAATLDDIFNGKDCKAGQKKVGFALLIFPFGEPNNSSRINYISNADREDMLTCMKEFIARAEGRYHDGGGWQ